MNERPLTINHRQYSLSELNQMSQAEFTAALASIWEETPVIVKKLGAIALLPILKLYMEQCLV